MRAIDVIVVPEFLRARAAPGHGLQFHAVPVFQHVVIQGGRVAGEDDLARQGLEQGKQVQMVLPSSRR